MASRPKGHGCSALAREDVADARRGHPEVSLEAYAAERGLEFHGRARLAGFRMALPRFEDYQHNLLRGVLPGGRFGILFHELLQTHFHEDGSIGGTFWAVRTSSPVSPWKAMRPNRTWLPVIGQFLDNGSDLDTGEPFGVAGAWAPTTTVATPVPESVARLPRLIVLRKNRTSLYGGSGTLDLGDFGGAGWRAHFDERTDQALLEALFSGTATDALNAMISDYAEVRLDHGMLLARRNGYLTEGDALDAFAGQLCRFADALAATAMPPGQAGDFFTPLPDCPWRDADDATVEPGFAGAWTADFRRDAAARGLHLEDPRAWHHAFPMLNVPGRVAAVMAGRVAPGVDARLLYATDVPVAATRAVRAVLAFPAPAGTPDTPPGGVRPEGRAMTVAVRGGVVTVWSHRLYGYCHEAETFVADALGAVAAVYPDTAVSRL